MVLCSTLIDALVAIGLLVPREAKGEIGCRRVARGILGTVLAFIAKLPFLVMGGLHNLDRRAVYVSRGVGHERGQAARLRFLCPPEISLITPERTR